MHEKQRWSPFRTNTKDVWSTRSTEDQETRQDGTQVRFVVRLEHRFDFNKSPFLILNSKTL